MSRSAALVTLVPVIAALVSRLAIPAAAVADTTAVQAVSPLEQVRRRVVETRDSARTPVVIFDLDDTLFRVTHRTKKILEAWAGTLPAARRDVRDAIAALDPDRMPYSVKATLDMAGIADPRLRQEADRAWGDGFFSSDFLAADAVIAGGPEYVRSLRTAGATIAYLTGRDRPRMEKGTLAQLARAGYPQPGPRVRLFLKPEPRTKDHEFKQAAVREIAALGTVVAGFDNEPRNVNILKNAFPDATIVFLEVAHSDNAPPVAPGILRVKDFVRR
jgi:hypothetical protein